MSGIIPIDRPQSLAKRAYVAIRAGIQDGSLSPEKRYSENEIATSMEISRTPVREALIELQREGLLQVTPQRGFRIRVLTEFEQQEVFDLRSVLEPFVARRLAISGTNDAEEELRQLVRQQEQVADRPNEFLMIDEQFHLLMPRLVGLERTHEIMRSLRGALWLIGTRALALPERAELVIGEHQEIVEAISARDPDAAAAATRLHIIKTATAALGSTQLPGKHMQEKA